jgi:hypothetical protein
MAGVKISELPAAGAITGTELVPVVQSASTVQTTTGALRSNLPNSALSQINTSTTDTTAGNISRNGDWGVGSTAVDIPDFTVTNANYSRFGRALPGAVGGSGAAMSVIAIPYDGTPVTNYLGITGSTTGSARLWAGTKSGSSPGTIGWTEFARLNSPTFTSNLGLGGISTTYLLSVAGSLTGGTTTGGINISSTIQPDVTTTAYGALIGPTTDASAFTLGTYTGVQVGLTRGAGSTITNAYGFRATSLLSTSATNAYGFYSEIAAGSGTKFNIYASGTAQNYLNGPLGLGAITQTGWTFRNLLSVTGATTAFQNTSGGVIQSDVTSTAIYNEANGNTVDASFTLPSLIYYRANQGTFGASSTVTNQAGFLAASSLIGAGSNFGFRGQIAAASGRWNIYMDGTADNFIAGNVGIGSNSFSGYTLRVNKALDNNNHKAIGSEGQVTNGGAAVDYFYTNSSQATAVSTTLLSHYRATQGTYTSAPTTQAGFNADSTLVGATNNYGFRGQIATAANRWNLYMDGTAPNYMAGSLGLGTTTVTAIGLVNSLAITGATTAYGARLIGEVQSGVTVAALGYDTGLRTQAASFTCPTLIHYRAFQGAFGAGSTVTSQTGFLADSGLVGAGTSNYGFRGLIPSATGRWNLYMDGTAQNFIQGNVGIGTSRTVPTCALDVNGLVAKSTANTLTAAGTNLGTALVLTAAYNVVTSAAASTGVALPNVVGAQIWIFNNQGTNAINVYPPTGTLNGAASVSLAANGKMLCIQIAAGVWYTMS